MFFYYVRYKHSSKYAIWVNVVKRFPTRIQAQEYIDSLRTFNKMPNLICEIIERKKRKG